MTDPCADLLALQRLVLDFAHRDRGDWAALQALFVPGARLHLSWYQGPVEGFVAASRAMAEAGAPASKHLIAPPRIDIAGARAIGQTDITILVRLATQGGELDLTSWARFHDRFIREAGQWRIAARVAVYEKDRIDPLPGTHLGEAWSPERLARQPAAYKHLAVLLEQVGQSVGADCITAASPAELALRARDRAWLAGMD